MEGLEEEAARAGSRGRIRRFASWWIQGPWRRRGPRLLLAIFLLYTLYACVTLRRPPIRGVVVDAQTGQPVRGAEVCAIGQATILLPVETATRQLAGRGFARTDAEGTFSMPSCHGMPCRDAILFAFIPRWYNATLTTTWAPGHVTAFTLDTNRLPLDGRRDPTHSLLRLPFYGYRYVIRLERADSHASWKTKCDRTLLAASENPREITDEWVFQDLSRYLQQWPQGEKAGWYLERILETQPYDCESLREKWVHGEISADRLHNLVSRSSAILQIASRATLPDERIAFNRVSESLKSRRLDQACLESLAQDVISRRESLGGAP
jgi:hypothetical protein